MYSLLQAGTAVVVEIVGNSSKRLCFVWGFKKKKVKLLLEIRTCTAFLFICSLVSMFSTKLLFSGVGQRKMLARWADGWQAATQPGACSPQLHRPRGLHVA